MIARIRNLRRAQHGNRRGHFVAEGPGALIAAVSAGAPIVEIVHSPKLCTSGIARRHIRDVRAAGMRVIRVDPDTYRELSTTPRASGVLTVLRERWTPLDALPPGSTPIHVAMGNVRSTGNLGSLVRTLDAVGGGGLLCVGGAVDPFSGDLVRATMGAIFRRPVVRTDLDPLRQWSRARGVQIVGASPGAGTPYDQTNLAEPTVLMLGEERTGLTDGERSICDRFVHLPNLGRVDSLNLAVAGAVVLYEALRQRRQRE